MNYQHILTQYSNILKQLNNNENSNYQNFDLKSLIKLFRRKKSFIIRLLSELSLLCYFSDFKKSVFVDYFAPGVENCHLLLILLKEIVGNYYNNIVLLYIDSSEFILFIRREYFEERGRRRIEGNKYLLDISNEMELIEKEPSPLIWEEEDKMNEKLKIFFQLLSRIEMNSRGYYELSVDSMNKKEMCYLPSILGYFLNYPVIYKLGEEKLENCLAGRNLRKHQIIVKSKKKMGNNEVELLSYTIPEEMNLDCSIFHEIEYDDEGNDFEIILKCETVVNERMVF